MSQQSQQKPRRKNKIDWQQFGRVLVTIDAANLEKSAQSLGLRVHYRHFRRYFQINCQFVQSRFYTATFFTARYDQFLASLHRIGIKVVTKPIKTINDRGSRRHIRKANFDVEIAVDVLDNLNNFDTLVLFSGDSDFDYLIQYLRGKAKRVLVFSTRYHISKELVKSADQYFDIKKFTDQFLKK